MNGARVAITTDEQEDGVSIACFLTGDAQIDEGLKPYLDRAGVRTWDFKPWVVESQMFMVDTSSEQQLEQILGLIEAYYISWGKEPSTRPMNDIID